MYIVAVVVQKEPAITLAAEVKVFRLATSLSTTALEQPSFLLFLMLLLLPLLSYLLLLLVFFFSGEDEKLLSP